MLIHNSVYACSKEGPQGSKVKAAFRKSRGKTTVTKGRPNANKIGRPRAL
jgi:hypothetical protein